MSTQEVRLFKNWWFLLLKGILILGFGIVFISAFWVNLLSKTPNYKVLIYTFIIITMVNGVLILFGIYYYRKNNSHWLYWFIEGTFDFLLGIAGIIGIIIIGAVKTHVLNMFFIQIISLWALIHGIIHSLSAVKLRNYVPSSRYALIAGILVIILSIILFLKPLFWTIHDTIVVGCFLIIIGVLLASISIILRRIYSY